MGDRIAVIDHGRVRQVGTPAAIYDDPADRFVATFVGTPPMNLVAWNGGHLGFRPEHFLPKQMIENGAVTEFSFRVDRTEYLGSERIVYGATRRLCHRPQEVTAKLPPAHVPLESIRSGRMACLCRSQQPPLLLRRGGQAGAPALTRGKPMVAIAEDSREEVPLRVRL